MLAVFKELYYAANDQKVADKRKADYQEGLEKSLVSSPDRFFPFLFVVAEKRSGGSP